MADAETENNSRPKTSEEMSASRAECIETMSQKIFQAGCRFTLIGERCFADVDTRTRKVETPSGTQEEQEYILPMESHYGFSETSKASHFTLTARRWKGGYSDRETSTDILSISIAVTIDPVTASHYEGMGSEAILVFGDAGEGHQTMLMWHSRIPSSAGPPGRYPDIGMARLTDQPHEVGLLHEVQQQLGINPHFVYRTFSWRPDQDMEAIEGKHIAQHGLYLDIMREIPAAML